MVSACSEKNPQDLPVFRKEFAFSMRNKSAGNFSCLNACWRANTISKPNGPAMEQPMEQKCRDITAGLLHVQCLLGAFSIPVTTYNFNTNDATSCVIARDQGSTVDGRLGIL